MTIKRFHIFKTFDIDGFDSDIDGGGDVFFPEGDEHDGQFEHLSNEHSGLSNTAIASSLTFGAKEDMIPFEEIFNENNLLSLYQDPFGVYAIQHNATHGLLIDDFLPKPQFGSTISETELQNFGNQAFDALGLKHIPIKISEFVPNAGYTPGFISRLSFDDRIFINPNYANHCINELGSTDIVLSDLAHEIGHYASQMAGGPQDTYSSEKIADFISGFLNAKFGVDIDVARKWFQLFYDPNGEGGYPISEERWDIEAAGYHFGKHATFDDLSSALKDKHFLEIINKYNTDTSQELAELERLNLMQSHDKTSIDVLSALGLDKSQARNMLANFVRAIKKR